MASQRGFLRHIEACNRAEPGDYLPFTIGGAAVGRVRHDIAHRLAEFPDLFAVGLREVALHPGFTDFAARFTDPPLAALDRGAVATLGVRAYGVHVNGFVRKPGGLHLWIGLRAKDKLVAPGKLDNLVAGGQPIGLSLTQNLIKECAEEADIAQPLALTAHGVGAITYAMAVPEGLRADTLFVYDLALDASFVPRNTDGELESFSLMSVDAVAERVRATDDFKFNVNLVIIDFLIRRGVIAPDHPEYLDLLSGLHRDHPTPWR